MGRTVIETRKSQQAVLAPREQVAAASRIVVKVGTNVIMRSDGSVSVGVLYGIAAAGEKLRVTIISPGFVQTNLADSMTNPEVKARLPMQWTRWRSRRTRLPAPLRSRSNSRPMWMWAR